MATPSYGDRPPLQGYRRSFTVPSRALSLHERAALDKSDADADILFSHSNARIVAFSPPTDSIPSTSKETLPETDYPVDTIETLPWRSRTETLASTGPFVIEKVRGSSNFLKSADQKVIHTIMRNSQCWCVDGESKFVLRIAKYRYYRIELPAETEADKEKVEELKTVLAKVLRFERTPCPFKRAFHVDLPEDAITPRRKVPWKRKQTPQLSPPDSDPLPLRRTKNSRAWSLQDQTTGTPLRTYGRRGSDYGFSTSRGSSPRPQYDGDGFRSTTPSSLASSEEANYGKLPEGSSEEGLNSEELHSKHEGDEESISESQSEGSQQQQLPEDSLAADRPSVPEVKEVSKEEETENDSRTQDNVEVPAPLETENQISEMATLSGKGEEEVVEPQVEEALEREPVHEGMEGLDTQREPDAGDAPVLELSKADTPNQNSGTFGDHHTEKRIQEIGFSTDPELGNASVSVGATDESLNLLPQRIEQADTESHGQLRAGQFPADETLESIEKATKADAIPVEEPTVPSTVDASLSRVSSADSFHSTNSLTQKSLAEHSHAADLETTPQAEKFDPFSPEVRKHRRELSELTVTASTIDGLSERGSELRPSTSESIQRPSTPGLAQSSSMSDSSWPEVHTPASSFNEGLRRRLNAKRSFSPLPPSATLFSPSSSSHRSLLNADFLQKAAHVALVKPIEAVVLLVHVLARIAGGATVNDLLNGELFRRPEHHRRSSSSFPDQVSAPRDDSDDEDDFGVPLRGRSRSVEAKPKSMSAKAEDDADSIFDLD